MSSVIFRAGTKAQYDALAVKDTQTFYFLNDVSDLYIGEVKLSNATDLAAAVADIAQNAADIAEIQSELETLEGDENVNGSIRNLIKAASDLLTAEINKKTTQVVVGPKGIARIFNESDGGGAKFEHQDGTNSFVGVNDEGGDDGIAGQLYVLKQIEGKNVGTRINMTRNGFYYTSGKNSSTFDALDEIATLRDVQEAAGDAANKTVYLVDESAGQQDYAKCYALYQGDDASDMTQNTLVGKINIPKDLVVKSGSIGTVAVDDEPYEGAKVGDKYIDLEIQNQAEHLYIPANSLVDIYTVNNQTSEVTLAIDGNNNITATIGEIAASKILFEVVGGTSTSVQTEIEGMKSAISDLETNLTWQVIE